MIERNWQTEALPKQERRVLREANGWRVLLETGTDNQNHPYKKRLDYYKGVLRQTLTWQGNELNKVVYLSGKGKLKFYEQNISFENGKRIITEIGHGARGVYVSVKGPDPYSYAQFSGKWPSEFVVEKCKNSNGWVRKVKQMDVNARYQLIKHTLQANGKAPEILDESKARKEARHSLSVIASRSDLNPKQKWKKVREIVEQYRAMDK